MGQVSRKRGSEGLLEEVPLVGQGGIPAIGVVVIRLGIWRAFLQTKASTTVPGHDGLRAFQNKKQLGLQEKHGRFGADLFVGWLKCTAGA